MINQITEYCRVVIPTLTERIVLFIGATFGVWISVGVGGFDEGFKILCLFMLADMITGIVAAWKKGAFETKIAAQGLFKKGFIVLMVMLCNGVDHALHVDFMRDACIMAYVLNEALSNVENIDRMGFGRLIPPFIRRGLAQLQNEKEQKFNHKIGGDEE